MYGYASTLKKGPTFISSSFVNLITSQATQKKNTSTQPIYLLHELSHLNFISYDEKHENSFQIANYNSVYVENINQTFFFPFLPNPKNPFIHSLKCMYMCVCTHSMSTYYPVCVHFYGFSF
jgi:hypothetical protein